jgi:hypothetical protein
MWDVRKWTVRRVCGFGKVRTRDCVAFATLLFAFRGLAFIAPVAACRVRFEGFGVAIWWPPPGSSSIGSMASRFCPSFSISAFPVLISIDIFCAFLCDAFA